MEPIEYDIEFPRGDTCAYKFKLIDAQKNILHPSASTEIYFTLKTNHNNTNAILQKKYSLGEITLDGDFLIIFFKHSDTTGLKMDFNYEYDISVIDGDFVGTLYIGKMRLSREVTHLANE